MTHVELQQAVIDLCHMLHWRHLHIRRSIGKGRQWVTTTNVTGWPDLLLWSPRQPGRHVAVELKVPPDRLRPEQRECLANLEASGFEVHVWTPDDLQAAATILAPPKGGNLTPVSPNQSDPGVTQ